VFFEEIINKTSLMKQNYPNNLHSVPFLTKRNDSYIYINVKNSGFPSNPLCSPGSVEPLYQHYTQPKSSFPAFEPRNQPFFKKHYSREFQPKVNSNANSKRNFDYSMIRKFKGIDDFYQTIENMEVQIFGRKLLNEPSWNGQNGFNDKQDFNLNLTPDFEKLNDSSQMLNYSIGAEDSPMIHRRRSPRKSNFSDVDTRRSTFCFKNKKIRKRNFLNDFKIQNNFNGISHDLFKKDSPKFKKIKKSFNMKFINKIGNLSDDNEDDKKTVLNKFKPTSESRNESLIYPVVINRSHNERLGSKRTVHSRRNASRHSSFKIPTISHQRYSDPAHCEILQDHRFNQNFTNQTKMNHFNKFKLAHQFGHKNEEIYFDFEKDKKQELNKIFVKKNEQVEKSKGHAADHIYKIMKNMSKIIYDRTLRRDKPRLKKDLEECLKDVDIKMNHLIGLKNLLSKFMKEEQITTSDMDLSNLEILLFCLFLVKKRYLDLEALQWTPKCLNQFREQEMLKRSEQNYKVVLKRAFKTLISTFNAENSVLGGNENEFYEHYFGKVSKEFGISIDSFKPQQIFNEIKSTKKTKKFEKRKSKKEFASMLKKSTEFMNLLQRYLEDDLILNGKNEGIFRDCMKELDRKLPLMIFNWQKRLGSEHDFKNEFIKFLVETLVNDKVKLPWSASEVRRGVSSVLRLFRKA
jgi:hypothetical protein